MDDIGSGICSPTQLEIRSLHTFSDDIGSYRTQRGILMSGLGTDIVSVSRIAKLVEKYGDRFLNRCFRPEEIQYALDRGPRSAAVLASRWAVKEAFIKALGSASKGVVYGDIEVVKDVGGAPVLLLHESASRAYAANGSGRIMVSLSHEDAYAMATVIIQDNL